MTLSKAILLASAAWCVLALAAQLLRARAFGRRRLFAPPAGDPGAGVRYAFLKGMTPGAKESVMMHLGAYATGICFHAGTAAAFLLMVTGAAGLDLPRALAHPLSVASLCGAAAGIVLMARRALDTLLRGLSHLDDYLSTALVTLFDTLTALSVLLSALEPQTARGLQAAWFAAASLLLFQVPLGKIRHCVFFFSSRRHFGAFLGRRGTFPPSPGPQGGRP